MQQQLLNVNQESIAVIFCWKPLRQHAPMYIDHLPLMCDTPTLSPPHALSSLTRGRIHVS